MSDTLKIKTMANKKTTIECTGYYELSYDDNSEEFKEAHKAYQKIIEKDGSVESMLFHVAHNLRRSQDVGQMVEGVGYIQKEDREIPKELFSGITVEDDDPDFQYEIY